MQKIVIIGAGILGCSLARELVSKKAGTILVLEKEPEAGLHASSRNSGVIHSGLNQKPGTLKAKFCVEGSRLLREYCRQWGVPMRECGTLVVAKSSEEELCLKRLYDMGQACGVPGLEMLDTPKIKEREPMAQGASGLFSPTGAVVDAKVLVETIKREAEELGAKFYFHQQVKKIECQKIFTYDRVFQPDHIINCAGVFADRIAHMMGCGQGLRIVPFLGSYYEVTNIDVAHKICAILDEMRPAKRTYCDLIEFVDDRPSHDLRYAIDPSRIRQELDWRASCTLAQGLEQTVDWYLKNEAWWRALQGRDGVGQRLGVKTGNWRKTAI